MGAIFDVLKRENILFLRLEALSGGLLEPSWAIQGRPGVFLGYIGAPLGCLGSLLCHLGPLLDHLGPFWSARGCAGGRAGACRADFDALSRGTLLARGATGIVV